MLVKSEILLNMASNQCQRNVCVCVCVCVRACVCFCACVFLRVCFAFLSSGGCVCVSNIAPVYSNQVCVDGILRVFIQLETCFLQTHLCHAPPCLDLFPPARPPARPPIYPYPTTREHRGKIINYIHELHI